MENLKKRKSFTELNEGYELTGIYAPVETVCRDS